MHNEVKEIATFIGEYATRLMGSGVHTSRVVRNTKRIGEALGITVKISTFQKTLILSLIDENYEEVYSQVVDIPAYPISFELNSELSSLSWQAIDDHLTLDELWIRYNEIIAKPKMHPLFVLIMASFANASFCALFEGDWWARGIVFSATMIGLFAKQRMQAHHINHYVIFIVSAFLASIVASTAFIFNTTAEIALATSVLYLIPGVPLINGVIDIVEGHVLNGFARLTHALLLVICISIGLSLTLALIKNNLL